MKLLAQLFILSLVLIFDLSQTEAHGKLWEPVNRGSMWRKGYNVTPSWNDSGNHCGNYDIQHNINGGKCGVCGDDYRDPRPRANENTGLYGHGIIVATYKSGQNIHVEVDFPANHLGFFRFQICPLNHPKELEEEECFDKYPLKFADGSDKYTLNKQENRIYATEVVLPQGLKCDQCVLRWEYLAGIPWGPCPDGSNHCGPQETFRTCSDIRIE